MRDNNGRLNAGQILIIIQKSRLVGLCDWYGSFSLLSKYLKTFSNFHKKKTFSNVVNRHPNNSRSLFSTEKLRLWFGYGALPFHHHRWSTKVKKKKNPITVIFYIFFLIRRTSQPWKYEIYRTVNLLVERPLELSPEGPFSSSSWVGAKVDWCHSLSSIRYEVQINQLALENYMHVLTNSLTQLITMFLIK